MAKWLDVETGLEQLFTLPEASLLPIAQLPGGDWLCERYSSVRGFHETGMPHGRAYSIEMMGGTPEEVPDRYFRASPANFIRNIKGRLLIVHGLADSNVSPENTRVACRDLLAAEIPFDLMTFDDEGHGIYKAGNREKLLNRIERFFAKAFA